MDEETLLDEQKLKRIVPSGCFLKTLVAVVALSALLTLILSIVPFPSSNPADSTPTSYFISPYGIDTNTGTSASSPWRTTYRVNLATLKPGDMILFESGVTHDDVALLVDLECGDHDNPCIIASYGQGNRPVLRGGQSIAIDIVNSEGVEVHNLTLKGMGSYATPGIRILSRNRTKPLDHVKLKHLEVSEFLVGVLLDSDTCHGYMNVHILDVTSHDNADSGIKSAGPWFDTYTCLSHANVTVEACETYLNKGNKSITNMFSGNGIMMSSVDNVLISRRSPQPCPASACFASRSCAQHCIRKRRR